MKFLFFVSVAWAADGLVNCPSDLPDHDFKVCVSDEINRIWKGSQRVKYRTDCYLNSFLKINIPWVDSLIRSYTNTLTTQLGDAKASISALEAENKFLKSDIDRLTRENILSEIEIEKLQAQSDEQAEMLSAFDVKIDNVEEELSGMAGIVNEQADKLTEIEENITEANSNIKEVEQHHKELSKGFKLVFWVNDIYQARFYQKTLTNNVWTTNPAQKRLWILKIWLSFIH